MTDTPQVDHDAPFLDSRGLSFGGGQILAPDNDLAWVKGRHTLTAVPGGYMPEGAPHARTGPCARCGEPAPPLVYGSPEGLEYYFCTVANDAACMERAAAGERIAGVATPEEPAAKTPYRPRNRPVRPSRAKKAALTEGTAKAAETAPQDASEPPEGGAA